jgi:hypothetical protein
VNFALTDKWRDTILFAFVAITTGAAMLVGDRIPTDEGLEH